MLGKVGVLQKRYLAASCNHTSLIFIFIIFFCQFIWINNLSGSNNKSSMFCVCIYMMEVWGIFFFFFNANMHFPIAKPVRSTGKRNLIIFFSHSLLASWRNFFLMTTTMREKEKHFLENFTFFFFAFVLLHFFNLKQIRFFFYYSRCCSSSFSW